MLSIEKINPMLLVGFDEVDEQTEELVNALSGAQGETSTVEAFQSYQTKIKNLASDVYKKQIRVPIVISDVIGIQHTGSASFTRKEVFYDNDDVVLSNETNSLTVKLEMKSALSTLSSAVDLFYALADKNMTRWGTNPRASFFSPNFCIYNAYLTGINRTGTASTDKEFLLLTFERTAKEPEEPREEATKQNDTPARKPVPDSTVTP